MQGNNVFGENNVENKGETLVAWEIGLRSKDKGGLASTFALLMNHLSKFYNKMDVPWERLVWSKYYSD